MDNKTNNNQIQLLITTVNLDDTKGLLQKLNVNSNFLIGNQSDKTSDVLLSYNGYSGLVINRNERGVGRNRNELISHATAEICVLSDDDMHFVDDYSKIVINSFTENPKADVIIFNIDDNNGGRRQNEVLKRISIVNYMNYGAARLAFRREAVVTHGILFNTMFGGGCKYSCGEDSLFIRECIRKGLKVIALPVTIAKLLDDRDSSWFKGYSEKFLFDQGVFLSLAHPVLCRLFSLLLCVKHPEYYKDYTSFWCALKQYNKGISYIKHRLYAV